MAKKPKSLRTFLTPYLRRASLAWPGRTQALTDARVDRGKYKCAMCEDIFKRTEVHADHIKSIVSTSEGFTNWDDYINAMFCSKEGFQILCETCHETKTMIEDKMRQNNKKKKKNGKRN
jgi:5-methylcytosine-specific restriction endonuclease McrA